MKKIVSSMITLTLLFPLDAVITRVSVYEKNQEKLQTFYNAKESDNIPDIEKLKKENRLFIAHINDGKYFKKFFTFETSDDATKLKNIWHDWLSLCYVDYVDEKDKDTIAPKPVMLK